MIASLIALDERIFHFLSSWYAVAPKLWLAFAVYPIYLVPLVLLWFWFARRREIALFAFVVGAFAWIGVNTFISQFIQRPRPLDMFRLMLPDQEGIFHRPGGSFPSDHTAFLTALLIIFWWKGERQVALFLLLLTVITVLARIVSGLHWPGDILAGGLVGLMTAAGLWIVRRPIERWLIDPLVRFARRLRL